MPCPRCPTAGLVDRINLHWLLGVDQHVAQGQGKSPARVAWKRGWRRLEPVLEDAQEWIAPWPLPCSGAPWGRGTGIIK